MPKPLANYGHELFAQSLAEGKKQVVAFVEAGYPESQARSKAHRIASRDDVKRRVVELRQMQAKRHNVTVDTLIEELEQAREVGMQEGQSGAMVAATMGKAKLLGFLDRHGEPTEKAVTIMGTTEAARRIAFMLRLGVEQDRERTIEHDSEPA